jgi:prepilin-type N-terminal cleavage/methylation domain-containing protein/prepilin-type processing-associated H-X9-DG protein
MLDHEGTHMNTCKHPAMASMRQRRGFSLIELLVVVSIIVVLSSLMLPMIAKIRDAAWIARCSSGQRQTAMAILAYGGDWQGVLIYMCRASDGAWWNTILQREDYETPAKVCPRYNGFGIGRNNRPFYNAVSMDSRNNNFGSWTPLQSSAVEIALSSVPLKAQRILTGDARGAWLDHWSGWWYKHEWGGTADPSRHGKSGGVYSFFDGHVKLIPEADTGMGLRNPPLNRYY